ncbi:glycosyltransferase family protein [Nitrobacter sp.]|uniref:hypothetical protein n=1 Tax=Nitrobacter sp. TaxID=29420 RepID=UPI00399D5874
MDSYRNSSEWCAFIDADELLHPVEGNGIEDVLKGVSSAPAVVHWLNFGSNGHETIPQGPGIESLRGGRFSKPPCDEVDRASRCDRGLSPSASGSCMSVVTRLGLAVDATHAWISVSGRPARRMAETVSSYIAWFRPQRSSARAPFAQRANASALPPPPC